MYPAPVLYPLRSVDTATVRFTDCPHGRRRITIDHRPLAGVTPAMLLDWFTHLGGTMTYGGEIIDRYLAWHPIDHIRWELARPAPAAAPPKGRGSTWSRRSAPGPNTRSTRSPGSRSSTRPASGSS